MSITSINPKDLKFIIYARKSTEEKTVKWLHSPTN